MNLDGHGDGGRASGHSGNHTMRRDAEAILASGWYCEARG